jgi:hypothetical protein
MFQTGIFNLSQLSSKLEKNLGPKNQPIAIDLYAQINELEPRQQGLAEEMILENFSFSDGAYKKTHAGRFDDFDEKILAYLEKNLAQDRPYKIHDLAISDGRTSYDFFLKLEKKFPTIDFCASDKNILVDVFPGVKNKTRKIVTEAGGKILQIIFPPFVLNIYSSKRALAFKIKKALFYPVNFILAQFFLVPLFRNILIKIDADKKQTIALVKKQVLDLAKTKSNFHLLGYDIMKKGFGEFEIIRAMNILNPTYFSSAEAKKIMANIFSSLKEGGLFIAGSNTNAASPVAGDLFVKKSGRMESLMKFGGGAPYREIILSTKAA